jgi:hypothetical protein
VPTATDTPTIASTDTPTATPTIDPSLDSDGDGCGDAAELALGLNPFDPWDFYNVPVPALFSAADPTLVVIDHAVSGSDAQAVFAYFKAGAKVGTTVYDQDLDTNGVADGRQYDRSYLAPGQSGPPDGIVSASDAQLVFAQFKLGYHC